MPDLPRSTEGVRVFTTPLSLSLSLRGAQRRSNPVELPARVAQFQWLRQGCLLVADRTNPIIPAEPEIRNPPAQADDPFPIPAEIPRTLRQVRWPLCKRA